MSLLMTLLVFLIGMGIGWFITRSMLFGLIAGIIALLFYCGILGLSFNLAKIVPSQLQGVLK